MSKYHGIDEREIKCCSTNPNSIEAGISFDYDNGINILRFHFLEYIEGRVLDQRTKSMHLNKETVQAIIKQLSEMQF